jgi:biopolymer transport protein ExbD
MKIRLPQVSEYFAPNLIPLLDVMLLLLIFFMMGGDLGQRELEEVRLPRAGSLKECLGSPSATRDLPINAYHRTDVTCQSYARAKGCPVDDHWRLDITGCDCTSPRVLLGALRKELARGDEGRLRVTIRSDAAAPFALAQRAMNACSEAGIHRMLAAARRPAADDGPRLHLPKRAPRPKGPEPTLFEKLFRLGGEPENEKGDQP